LPLSMAMLAAAGAAAGWLFGLLVTGHPFLAELQRIVSGPLVRRAA